MTIEGVKGCDVRIDAAGKKPHIRLRVLLGGSPRYERVHAISSMVDHEVRRVVPNARVSIRTGPEDALETQGIWELVKRVADHEPGSRGAHNVHIENVDGKLGVDFGLEVSSGLTVKEAHEVATRVEKKLKAENPRISDVVIHEETTSNRVSGERLGQGRELRWYVEHVMKRFPEAKLESPPVIRPVGERQLHVIIHASFSPDLSTEMTTQVTSRIEAALKNGFPWIVRVDVVREPSGETADSRRAGRQPA